MIVRLEDQTGTTVVLNTDNLVAVVQSRDKNDIPLLGKCIAITINGTILLGGTPDEIYGRLRKYELPQSENHTEARN